MAPVSSRALVSAAALLERAECRFAASAEATEAFFEQNGERVAQACRAMARRFEAGGRLLAFGLGAAATDAHHVSVEFLHPVLVGKRALPSVALTSDAAALTGQHDALGGFAALIDRLGRPEDIALGIRPTRQPTDAVAAGLDRAGAGGLLAIELAGGSGPIAERPDGFVFVVPSDDPMVVQEVHETLYHVFWEVVHVFFAHRVSA